MGTISGDGTAVTGLGGADGYGETALPRGDDVYAQVDVSAVFESGFTLDGVHYDGSDLFISTDGFVTFGTGVSAAPANPANLTTPFLAIFMADVDTRIDGEAPDSGQIWVDVDPVADCVTITWEDVGFYRRDASETDTFQMQLYDRGGGAMDVVYRYENVDWTTGDLQGGFGGTGGTPAFIGYRTAASGAVTAVAGSGDGAAELALPTTVGNTGVLGLYVFRIGGSTTALTGSAGNDTLQGSSGADLIQALGGDDWIFASGGTDTVDGGGGKDILDFSSATASIVLNLTSASSNTGWAKGLVLSNIESFIGTGLADRLLGSTGNDWLDGWSGNDSLSGAGGNDSLYGNAGSDTLVGGSNADLLDGGTSNDTVSGGDGNDSLYGGTGSDTLAGDAGNDSLEGSDGTDSLYGGDGNDTLKGGSAGDRLDGGTGTDLVDYAEASAAVLADMAAPTGNKGYAAGDTYVGIEALSGSAFNDTLRGTSGAETLWGQAGNDSLGSGGGGDHLYGGDGNDTLLGGTAAETLSGDDGADSLTGSDGNDSLYGGAGNDTLNGGAGADSLDGGNNTDLLSYAGATAAVLVNLGTPGSNLGWAKGDVLTSIEQIIGSSYNDTLIGMSGTPTLYGGAGNDSVQGLSGTNALYGGTDNDTVQGNTGADQLWGDDGNDLVVGNSGNDTLFGGNGSDTLQGGDGADSLDGGAGNDRADYSTASSLIVLDLTASGNNVGWAKGDVLIGIEVVEGSTFGDTLRGDSAANLFFGGNGNDSLSGMAGNNTLNGDGGNDTLLGGSGQDSLTGGGGNDSVSGSDADDFLFGGAGADHIYGGTGADVLWGGDDNDGLYGGDAADTLSGDAGSDTLTGGAAADVFVASGAKGQGGDLVTDYDKAGGDVLQITIAGLHAADFTLTRATVTGDGSDAVAEVEIMLKSTGEVIWTIEDGASMSGFLVQSGIDAPFSLL